MNISAYNRKSDIGLLILRLGIGTTFLLHGVPKLMAGPQVLDQIGGVMAIVGLGYMPAAWGLAAAITESLGGALLIFGWFTAQAAMAMTTVMAMATLYHIEKGDGFSVYSHPLELGIVLLSLTLIGPGRISLDALRFRGRSQN